MREEEHTSFPWDHENLFDPERIYTADDVADWSKQLLGAVQQNQKIASILMRVMYRIAVHRTLESSDTARTDEERACVVSDLIEKMDCLLSFNNLAMRWIGEYAEIDPHLDEALSELDQTSTLDEALATMTAYLNRTEAEMDVKAQMADQIVSHEFEGPVQ